MFICFSLGNEGKSWLKKYGVVNADKLKFRDAWVFIGQRGLKEGAATEKVRWVLIICTKFRFQ